MYVIWVPRHERRWSVYIYIQSIWMDNSVQYININNSDVNQLNREILGVYR